MEIEVPMPPELLETWDSAAKKYREVFDDIQSKGEPFETGHLDGVGGLDGELENWEHWRGEIDSIAGDATSAAEAIKEFLTELGDLLAKEDVLYFCDGMSGALLQLDGAVGNYIDVVKRAKYEATGEEETTVPRNDAYPAVMNTLQQLAGSQSGGKSPLDFFFLDREKVDEQSHTNMSDSPEGASLGFLQRNDMVLIGSQGFEAFLQCKSSFGSGVLVVDSKGGALSSGSIKVSGAADEAAFKAAVKRFSKKSITFA